MKNKLYIATLEIFFTPKNKQSRYLPVKIKKELQPIILDSDTFRIPEDRFDEEIRYHNRYKKNNEWKNKVNDLTRYDITYQISKVKFSSELYGNK
jgi:hypothetical protein